MRDYSLSHLSDPVLLRDLGGLVARDRATTAELLAHIAEVDERKLYLPAAYPSMHAYCVGELRFSEDAAYKRIQAARAARRFPTIFPAVADGRLHLAAVCLLAPHLTPQNAAELLTVAAGQSKSEIEVLLAQRFPRSEMLPLVQEIPGSAAPPSAQLAPGQVEAYPSRPAEPPARERVAPIAPQRYELRFSIGQSAHEKLRYAQALLGHQVPAGEIAQVIERALDALIERLEQRKFAATPKPRAGAPRMSGNPRHIPAAVKRAVWERDGGQCTFLSERGQRCQARTRLEFDHLQPVARGGEATVGGLQLKCRAHNQYAAERTFGVGFMEQKRGEARQERATARAAIAGQPEAAEEVIPYLRHLGVRMDEARRAAALCESIPEATLEERVRLAIQSLAPPRRVVRPPLAT